MQPIHCLLTFLFFAAASGCADTPDPQNTAAKSSTAPPEQASTAKSTAVESAAGDSFNCEEDFAKDAALADRLNATQDNQNKREGGQATSEPAAKSAANKATALPPEEQAAPAAEATN